MQTSRTIIGIVATAAASLYISPAVAAPQATPKPGNLVIAVKGLPKAKKATVKVRGPGKYHTKFRTATGKTLKRLKPGIYRVAAADVPGYSSAVKPGKVRLSKRRGAKVRIRFTATGQAPDPSDPGSQSLPEQPWAGMPGPASISGVSVSSDGAIGNELSDYASWSPDGGRIVFSSCATNLVAGTSGCFAYLKDLSTGEVTRLNKAYLGSESSLGQDWSGETTWAPAGGRIAFTTIEKLAGDTDTNKDVYTIAEDGTDLRRAHAALSGTEVPQAARPRWSPTSASLLFWSSATNLAPGTGRLYVTEGTGIARLGTAESINGLAWHPDGGSVFYLAGDDRVGPPPAFDWISDYDLYRQAPGAAPERLTTGWLGMGSPAPAPDGTRVAVASGAQLSADDTNATTDIYIASTSGAPPVRLSVDQAGQQTEWQLMSPAWSPDGSKVAMIGDGGERGQSLLVKDLASGVVTAVLPGRSEPYCSDWVTDEESGEVYCGGSGYASSTVEHIQWSPDGTRIAFTTNVNDLVPGDTGWTRDVFVATL